MSGTNSINDVSVPFKRLGEALTVQDSTHNTRAPESKAATWNSATAMCCFISVKVTEKETKKLQI